MFVFRSGLLERMPAMKENSESPESFGSIANGEVTTPAEVVAGERNSISFHYAVELGIGAVKPSWLVEHASWARAYPFTCQIK